MLLQRAFIRKGNSLIFLKDFTQNIIFQLSNVISGAGAHALSNKAIVAVVPIRLPAVKNLRKKLSNEDSVLKPHPKSLQLTAILLYIQNF